MYPSVLSSLAAPVRPAFKPPYLASASGLRLIDPTIYTPSTLRSNSGLSNPHSSTHRVAAQPN